MYSVGWFEIGAQRLGKNVRGNSHGIILGYYQGTILEGLRKMTKKLVQDSPCPGQDSKSGPSERNSEAPSSAHTSTEADRTTAPAPWISCPVMTLTPAHPTSRINKTYWDVLKGTTPYCKSDCIRGIHSAASHLIRHTTHTDVACNGAGNIHFLLCAHRRTTERSHDANYKRQSLRCWQHSTTTPIRMQITLSENL
jgi:hypothetical protein